MYLHDCDVLSTTAGDRFNTAGFVTNITPRGESERYVVKYESNGDLKKVRSKSSGRRNLSAITADGGDGDETEVTENMAAPRKKPNTLKGLGLLTHPAFAQQYLN